MKRATIIFLFSVMLTFQQVDATEINFVSQAGDSLFYKTLCWQPGNLYRPIILLDGEWEYRASEKDSWKKVRLPAACDYLGELTFRKSFIPDSSFASHFFRLICYGINYDCRIFINTKFVGTHAGGYSSFAFDITDGIIIIGEKNTIEIKVDTRLDSKHTIPQQFQPEGMKQTFGIYRSIYLLAIPELSIEDLNVDYQLNPDFSACEFSVNFNLKDRYDNSSNQGIQKFSKSSLEYNIELKTGDDVKPLIQQKGILATESYFLTRALAEKFILKNPQLWSPETPTLYNLKIQLLQGKTMLDQVDQTVGLKQIDFRSGDIFLNGSRYLLKGVNWSEDYLIDGALFDQQQLVSEIESIKQLHANAVRVLNHPPHPMLATLCDSLGLFLLQEIPHNWVPPTFFKSDVFVNQNMDYLTETITRDQAHVSVFAWGIGGQFLLADSTNKNFINKITKKVSPFNRLPFYTWNSPPLSSSEIDPNIMTGISVFNLDKNKIQPALSAWIRQNQNRISLVLSFGAPQRGQQSGGDNIVRFEEYQVLQIMNAWTAIASFPEIDGYFITSLSDYRGNYPSTNLVRCPNSNLRPFGLMDYDRKKRVAYEAVQSLYREGKCRYNPNVELTKDQPAEFPIVGLATILVFLFLINSRRYFRDNFKRIFIHPHGFYVDLRDGRKVPPSHTILMALFVSIGIGLVMASLLSYFKNQSQIDHLMTLLLPRPNWKTSFCQLSWQPGWSILFFSIAALLSFVLLAIYFKLIAIISGKRFSIVQSLAMPFWLGGNFVILVPIGLVLFRIAHYEQVFIPTLLGLIVIGFWFLLRVIKGMRVMFIWPFRHAFIVLVLTLAIIVSGILYYYQSNYSLVDYLKYYYQIYGDQIIARLSF